MKFTLKNSAYPLIAIVATAYLSLGISGGPNYGASKRFVNVVGSYAGVLEPVAVPNNLGIFTLVVPQVGLATGTFSIFSGGTTFAGTISAVANPNKRSVRGAFESSAIADASTSPPHADGSLNAFIRPSRGGISSVSSTRLTGTAHVTTTVGVTKTDIDYTVDGFKQSN